MRTAKDNTNLPKRYYRPEMKRCPYCQWKLKRWYKLWDKYLTILEAKINVVRLLRIAAILWLGYLVVLVLIDPDVPYQLFEYRFYVMNGLNALIVLGLAMWSGPKNGWGGHFYHW